MWLLRIDEATYLLIEGLGPQEANLYCDESEAMKAFRRTTAITYSCPLSPLSLSHILSPEGSTVNEEHDLLDRLEEVEEEVTKVRQRVRELLSNMQSQKGEDAGESS